MSEPTAGSVLLCSGGLDSTTLAYWLESGGIQFVPLFIDYGQHCALTERSRLERTLPPGLASRLVSLDVSSVYRGSSSRLIRAPDLWNDVVSDADFYLPYRNLLLLTIGAAYAQSQGLGTVYAAFINSNHAKEIDCSAAFFGRLGGLLSEYGGVRVEMPFRDMSKAEVARIGVSLGAPIAYTFSCQASPSVPCGVCPNCLDRTDALARLT
jgi:7-cyano-7-deazaguanine synthase